MTYNQISYAAHRENVRHNLVNENQGQQSIDENKRHNKEQEAIGYANASAALSQASSAAFNARTNQLKYEEDARHNVEQEQIEAGKFSASGKFFGSGFSYSGNMANYKNVVNKQSTQPLYKSLYGPDFYAGVSKSNTVVSPNFNSLYGPDYYAATKN